ncbi:hypothetical protein F-S17_0237 [Faustovirus]|nr:hypothetical protein F-M6_0243 [Faustovirus]QJX72503.1 hypothetical protein F-S17_0237 [Faustovirus]QJX74012.1 hypothetical protein F-E9_258 [Faustovirus]
MLQSFEPIKCCGYALLIRVNRHGVITEKSKIPVGYQGDILVYSFPAIMNATEQKPKGTEYITPLDWEGYLDWQQNVHWCEWEMRSEYRGMQGRPKYQLTKAGVKLLLDHLNTARNMRAKKLKYKIDKIVQYRVNEHPTTERPEFVPNMDLADDYESEEEEPEEPIVARPMRNQWRRLRRNDDVTEEPMQRAHRVATRSRAPIIISDESSEESDVEEERIPMDYRSSDEDNEYDFDDGFIVPDDVI